MYQKKHQKFFALFSIRFILSLQFAQPFSDSFNFLVVHFGVWRHSKRCYMKCASKGLQLRGGSKPSRMRMEHIRTSHTHIQYKHINTHIRVYNNMNKIKELTKSQVFIYNVLPYIPFIFFIGYRQSLSHPPSHPTSSLAFFIVIVFFSSNICFCSGFAIEQFYCCLLVVKMSAFQCECVYMCRFQSNFILTRARNTHASKRKREKKWKY